MVNLGQGVLIGNMEKNSDRLHLSLPQTLFLSLSIHFKINIFNDYIDLHHRYDYQHNDLYIFTCQTLLINLVKPRLLPASADSERTYSASRLE